MPLERTRLGKTNLEVLRLGFGGIPIQSIREKEAIALVRYGLDLGMDFVDTARAYTTSEERIGKALSGRAQRPFISSKSTVRKAEEMEEQVQVSQNTLGVEHIHLYNAHAVNNHEQYDMVMGSGGAYEGLQRSRDKGLIGYIGITSHNLGVLERAVEEEHFETIMVGYSVLEPEAEEKVIPKAIEKDMGILIMKPFSGGVLESGALALKYVLSCPDSVVIPGLHTIEQAGENWQVFMGDWTYTSGEWAQVESLRKEYSGLFCRRCDYCQPCPENIRIQLVLGAKRVIKNFGDKAVSLEWFAQAVETARNCCECGECESRCPYELPIREMIKENLAWLDARG
jgi:predicted aldo/keto reductase-like oxidoreductase